MGSYIASNDELYKFPLEPEGANAERTRPGCNWHGCSHDLQDVGRKFFHLKANKDNFRLLRFAHFILELDGDTVVRKSSVSSDGFDRYPFQFVEFDSLEPTNNKYLIGPLNKRAAQRPWISTWQTTGAVCRVLALEVRTRDMLIETADRHCGLYQLFFTAYRLYLSSTSSTLIVDDEQIPVLKRLKIDDSGVELTKEMLPPDNTEAKAGTLENLLMWARNQKYDSSTFHCVVRIDKVRTKKGWNYPSCGGEKCKECNLERKDGRFWCDSCNSSVDYPVIRYRLELDISDAIAEAVVVMFPRQSRVNQKNLREESSVANSKAKGEDVGYYSDTRKRKRMEFDDTE
ncbi:nucleic acid-binding, OB-fold protein [Tanacetum coccineum]